MYNIHRHIILIIFFLSSTNLYAQYTYEWSDYYDRNSMEEVASIVRTSDDNIFIVGQSKDTVDGVWLVKISPEGKKMWTRSYTGFPLMRAAKIIETQDDKIIIVGTASELDTMYHKIWLMKTTLTGDVLWEKLYKGQGEAISTDAIITANNEIVISGYTSKTPDSETDWYVIKLDSLGNKVWDKSFGSGYNDRAMSLTQLYDNSLIVAGYNSYSKGGLKKATILKLLDSGIDLWAQDIKLGKWSTANSVVATSDSNFVLLTEVKRKGLINFNTVVYKMTPKGDSIWSIEINKEFMAHPANVIETYDLGYAIAYTNKSDGVGNTNISVIKLNLDGKIDWERVFVRKSDDYASQIIEDNNNALFIGASTFSIGKAWNYGIIKFKNIERSDLIFKNIIKNAITLFNDTVVVDANIVGYKKPKILKVYNNSELIYFTNEFKLTDAENYFYNIKLKISLHKGLNVIDFIITDYKDYTFLKSKKMYYIPASSPHW